MIEGNYQFEIHVAANTSMIQHENERELMISHTEHRGPLWELIARFGSVLVKLGTSMERLALIDEKIHVDV